MPQTLLSHTSRPYSPPSYVRLVQSTRTCTPKSTTSPLPPAPPLNPLEKKTLPKPPKSEAGYNKTPKKNTKSRYRGRTAEPRPLQPRLASVTPSPYLSRKVFRYPFSMTARSPAAILSVLAGNEQPTIPRHCPPAAFNARYARLDKGVEACVVSGALGFLSPRRRFPLRGKINHL